MLGASDKVAGVSVWTAPNDRKSIEELLAEGPALFIFYLFDWSST